MAGTHTEAVLNKLNKQELVQLFLNTEANMGSKISATSNEIKDQLEEVAILKSVNEKLL